jgi:hypothetical protein
MVAGCHRRAWLTLGARTVDLEDIAAGYGLEELTLALPEVRDVVTARPDANGTDDRTRLMGSRVVTAHIRIWGARGRTIDDIARMFTPFLLPSARPELHLVLDTPENEYAERVITLRAAAAAAPITGPFSRSVNLGFVAPDPVLWDAAERETVARPFREGGFGRRYDLTFDRHYPKGTGGEVVGLIESPGDVLVAPRYVMVGPITGPVLRVTSFPPGEPVRTVRMAVDRSVRLDHGRTATIDTEARTVSNDVGRNLLDAVDWAVSEWPFALPGARNMVHLEGETVDGNTQVIARWRDGYLG